MHPKKIILTGVSGQLGHALSSALSEYQVINLTRKELDLTNSDSMRNVVREIKPDLIINPAAYTAVDKAETERDLAHTINAVAPQVLAEEAARLGAALIHFSTDYVFDGIKTTPYVETDTPNPISVYGKTKLAGEKAIVGVGLPYLILRTSWLYGAYGKNFLKTILRLAGEHESLRIVSDQFGAPTSNVAIVNAVHQLIAAWDTEQSIQTGVYHMTCSGKTSWHEFACEIIDQYKKLNVNAALKVRVKNVHKTLGAEYITDASRPENSCLDNSKLKQAFDIVLPSWQQGLQEVLHQLN